MRSLPVEAGALLLVRLPALFLRVSLPGLVAALRMLLRFSVALLRLLAITTLIGGQGRLHPSRREKNADGEQTAP